MNAHSHPGGHPAVHGMLIFGEGPFYLSHLPMFHPPHDLQLIIEGTFDGAGHPEDLYRRDRAETGEKVYTWVPTAFVLQDLLSPSPGKAQMTGRIFRGHFERGGVPISREVGCAVSRVIHSHPLAAAGPRDQHPRYVLFGEPGRAFAAHMISGAPDFDQVTSVDIAPPAASPVIAEVMDHANDAAGRLQPDGRVRVTTDAGHVTVKCLDEIYLETGDLSE
jgi:hypothetical protein